MNHNLITKLVGLPELVVTDVETKAESVCFTVSSNYNTVPCPECGKKTSNIHSRRTQPIRDLSALGKQTILLLEKKRFKCYSCDAQPFIEPIKSVDRYQRMTTRYCSYLAHLTQYRSYSEIARSEGLSFPVVKQVADKKADFISDCIGLSKGLKSLSIDEFAILKRHKYGVVISDPEHQLIVDVLPHRNKDYIINYFLSWPEEIRLGIEHVSIDMWGPYAALIPECFPNARITIDKFHVIAHLNEAMEKVRREQQKELLPQESKKTFFKSRFSLLKAGENLKQKDTDRLQNMLEKSPTLELAYELKEDFRELMMAESYEEAKECLYDWYEQAEKSEIPSFIEFIKMVKRWEDKILNFFISGITNGYAEGVNNKIKLVKRIGYGVPNSENLRRRILLSFYEKGSCKLVQSTDSVKEKKDTFKGWKANDSKIA